MNFKDFSKINFTRCTSPNGFNHQLKDWSIAEWTNAVAGEVGEACNKAKKLIRIRDDAPGNKPGETSDQLQLMIAHELCDVIIYADLAIQALGFETEHLLLKVFNAKSLEIGYPLIQATPGND